MAGRRGLTMWLPMKLCTVILYGWEREICVSFILECLQTVYDEEIMSCLMVEWCSMFREGRQIMEIEIAIYLSSHPRMKSLLPRWTFT
ncbi:hypothetical protein TNCV_2981381 [Trichonephila clavipes]|nr:hypothetical protein TNCV_2981381 [Trichonephila clavipes]